jgi:heme exporter protein CcmD
MGEYAAFIWSAYAIAAVVIAALTFHIWRDMRRQHALLGELEARGAPRRRPAVAAGIQSYGSGM